MDFILIVAGIMLVGFFVAKRMGDTNMDYDERKDAEKNSDDLM